MSKTRCPSLCFPNRCDTSATAYHLDRTALFARRADVLPVLADVLEEAGYDPADDEDPGPPAGRLLSDCRVVRDVIGEYSPSEGGSPVELDDALALPPGESSSFFKATSDSRSTSTASPRWRTC